MQARVPIPVAEVEPADLVAGDDCRRARNLRTEPRIPESQQGRCPICGRLMYPWIDDAGKPGWTCRCAGPESLRPRVERRK